jgi:hypothetical protein
MKVRYPVVAEVAVAGDFEAVLSFGIGLNRPATFRVHTLTRPSRVVIDLLHEAGCQRLWPEHSVAQAVEVQQAVEDGHQPWRTDPR